MKVIIAILALACALAADKKAAPAPPAAETPAVASDARTDLDDHEKVEMWGKLGEMNDLFQQQQVLGERLKVMGLAWEARVAEHRKKHNAVGCVLDPKLMHWDNCAPPKK